MPAAFAPPNFRAIWVGPNAVRLFWDGPPEAISYRVVRNGGNMPATSFDVSGLSFLDQNLPDGQYAYIICSLMRLANGQQYGGEFSAPVTVSVRPFNIVAVGDSVMWGQGLRSADKFASKTRDWIGSQLGVPVSPVNLKAHSGAVTFRDDPTLENRSFDGEVPSSYPTIARQIELASSAGTPNQVPAADVDLVLVDGCANNVGIFKVLAPAPLDVQLRSQIRQYCNDGMSNILTKVVGAFPNADVIVTGYFRFVTEKSDLSLLSPLFAVVGGLVPIPVIGDLVVSEAMRARSAARSDLFYNESNDSLQAAVNFANAAPSEGRTRFNQIHFALLVPGLENSYGARDTWQWHVPTVPSLYDDVYQLRHAACDQAAHTPSDRDLDPTDLCYEASMGHPNVAGAQAYTNAIVATASPLLPTWKSTHVGPFMAAMDKVVVGVQLGAEEPDGADIAVTATDPVSGAFLPGKVQFNGVDSGPLGTQLRYRFQASNPTDTLVTVQPQGRRPRYFSIPVRTLSVSVNVRNNLSLIVNATDAITGRLLSGTVTINPHAPNAVSAPTGQPISLAACAPSSSNARPQVMLGRAGQAPCGGIVHVPFYPDKPF